MWNFANILGIILGHFATFLDYFEDLLKICWKAVKTMKNHPQTIETFL